MSMLCEPDDPGSNPEMLLRTLITRFGRLLLREVRKPLYVSAVNARENLTALTSPRPHCQKFFTFVFLG